ncbi:hypothetical protein DFA_11121 [Cavenderia fasciculata]|uniref:F-box domain-containing protein n=1 Tax=Cavenderia fasciculata TaxID=261658 RepID=F4QF01_CACFS|nr:uncharacterized protein DFA_11121 [Cavenderia fasciculata]EGG13360.1 hypothetical protein DFA_11121 [Cavenderia fasciculata]|eukprot:XP_004350064.1 hypothetical protein DFA_11121 [Cavenderia fasciculata]
MQEIPVVIQHYVLSKYNTKFIRLSDRNQVYHLTKDVGLNARISHLALVCKRWFRILSVLVSQHRDGVLIEELPKSLLSEQQQKQQGSDVHESTPNSMSQYMLTFSLTHVHTLVIHYGDYDNGTGTNLNSTQNVISMIKTMTMLERVALRIKNLRQPKLDRADEKGMIGLVESINQLNRNREFAIKIEARIWIKILVYTNTTWEIGYLEKLCTNLGVEMTKLHWHREDIGKPNRDYSCFDALCHNVESLKPKHLTIINHADKYRDTIPPYASFKLFNLNYDGLERVNIKVGLVKIRYINILLQSKTIKSLMIRFQWHNEYDDLTQEQSKNPLSLILSLQKAAPLIEEMAQHLQNNKTLTSLTIKDGYESANEYRLPSFDQMINNPFANLLSNNQTSLKHLAFENSEDYLDQRFYQSITNNTTLQSLRIRFGDFKYVNSMEYQKQSISSICTSLSINRTLQSLNIVLAQYLKEDLINQFIQIPNRNCLLIVHEKNGIITI